ncbi:branched-chain amino acid ABC transporter permease [Hydrogenophaga sp. OTU3427]|uniref:branched-chain amino acid ABC transporter permease n=1 Tax=Hydrogenophaga sp. OTU3427 TaxID=3043856 RepID=UPI00313B2DE3
MTVVSEQTSRGNAALAVAGVALLTVFSILVLHVHDQWALLVVLVLAAAVGWGARRAGLAASASQALAQRPALLNSLVVMAFVAIVAFFHEDHFVLLLVATLLLYAVVCMGLNLQIGYCGVMNFAGAAFFGTGAYTAAVLASHTAVPHLLVLLAGGLAAALIGSVLLLPVLRTRGHYAALVTIAFGTMFRSFLEVNDTLGGPQGLRVPALNLFGWDLSQGLEIGGISLSFYVNYVVLAFFLTALVFTFTRRIERSWVGLNFDAIRIDETAAATFGLNIARWKITAFIFGNFLAGVAGAFFALMTAFVAPTNFTFADSLVLLSIVVLGGIGNLWAILPAAAIVFLLPEKLQAIQEYRFLLYSAAVILILLFRADGLFPRRLRNHLPGWSRK